MIRILWNSKKNSLSAVVTQNIKKVFILFVRIITKHHQLQEALDVDLIMCTYRHVLVLPSRRLERPAAVDDFDI